MKLNAGARYRHPKLTGAESLSGRQFAATLGKFVAAVPRAKILFLASGIIGLGRESQAQANAAG
jgi:hypothetical protein